MDKTIIGCTAALIVTMAICTVTIKSAVDKSAPDMQETEHLLGVIADRLLPPSAASELPKSGDDALLNGPGWTLENGKEVPTPKH